MTETFTPNAVIFSKATDHYRDAYVFFFPEEEKANAFRAECYGLHRSTGDVTAYTLKGKDTPDTTLYYVAVPSETTMGLIGRNILHLLSEKGVEAIRKHCREHDSKNPDALSREEILDQALLRSEQDKLRASGARHADSSPHNPNMIVQENNSCSFIFRTAADAARFLDAANTHTNKGTIESLVDKNDSLSGHGTYRITIQASDIERILPHLDHNNASVQRLAANHTATTAHTEQPTAAPAPIPTPLPMPMPTPAPGPALPTTNEQSSFAQRVLENRTHTQERSPSP